MSRTPAFRFVLVCSLLALPACAHEPAAGSDAGAPGSDAATPSSCGATGRSGTTPCEVTPSGTCAAGQWCNLEMVTCSVGCTSDANCPADEQCVRAAGEGVGVCQPCTSCGDGRCDPGEQCTADCGMPARCGDGVCNEVPASCPSDCSTGPVCGDGACNGTETATSCPADCAAGPDCGDGTCNGAETRASCPGDCPPVCGDGTCEGSESALLCPADCDDGRDRCFQICNDFVFFECVSSASTCTAACDASTRGARQSFADCVNVTACDTYDACIGLL
ncbi:MAG: hypothetical protein U0234_33025 [Sandaracinus sp.]